MKTLSPAAYSSYFGIVLIVAGCGGTAVNQNQPQTGWQPASQSLNAFGITQERVLASSQNETGYFADKADAVMATVTRDLVSETATYNHNGLTLQIASESNGQLSVTCNGTA